MGWFSRSTNESSSSKPDATDAQLREIGRLVNAGQLDAAQKITESTRDPRATAFASFRYIDVADEG